MKLSCWKKSKRGEGTYQDGVVSGTKNSCPNDGKILSMYQRLKLNIRVNPDKGTNPWLLLYMV